MNKIFLIISTLLFLAAVLTLLISRRSVTKTINTLSSMLEATSEGTYHENLFNESRLSALETQFADFILSSAVSAQKVESERDTIKTLISDISHQTKTPISNLMLYSELLAEENLPENARISVDAISRQTSKLRFLIDALVKLSRLENGILVLSPVRNEINPMLEDLYSQFLPAAKTKNISLNLNSTAAAACFDRKWTAEALGNIIDNAIKYTSSGSVTISVHEYEMFTRIDIADTGMGIPESEQAEIFSRFYRSENVSEKEGVGIGLYLSRQIISAENGYIKLSSQQGIGSVFSVFLPNVSEMS